MKRKFSVLFFFFLIEISITGFVILDTIFATGLSTLDEKILAKLFVSLNPLMLSFHSYIELLHNSNSVIPVIYSAYLAHT